jgi:hypothetical protein
MKKIKTRPHISTSASFVAVPSAFAAADVGLRNVIKPEFKTVFSDYGTDALSLETVFSPNALTSLLRVGHEEGKAQATSIRLKERSE